MLEVIPEPGTGVVGTGGEALDQRRVAIAEGGSAIMRRLVGVSLAAESEPPSTADIGKLGQLISQYGGFGHHITSL